MNLFLGIDVGTSGVRTAVVDAVGSVIAATSVKMESPIRVDGRPCQDANIWWNAVCDCVHRLASDLGQLGHRMSDVAALAVDGTSGTLLLTDAQLDPMTRGYMYNSANFDEQAARIAKYAPENSLARGSGSTLARLLFLQEQTSRPAHHALHQADWIAAKLMSRGGMSDETNVLKMGYDVVERTWPNWFPDCGVEMNLIPAVTPVGGLLDVVGAQSIDTFGFSAQTRVVAGATDSNAAFLAAGASQIGDGVTSLGTTLAIKLLSDQPIVDPKRGIYSHRIGNMWLPGGASNTGGGVLLKYFSAEQMGEMERDLNPSTSTGLDYYPLSDPGERFPIADASLPPKLTPRPNNDAIFYQAMLEGISEIERIGYAALNQLGAPKLGRVFTAGGGAKNKAWSQIRSRALGVPLPDAYSAEAVVGTARIAADLIP
jgi:sugar (pentulose or hexulose) kinase